MSRPVVMSHASPVPIHTALDRFFEYYYRRGPVQATFTGIHDYDGRLPDWSAEGLEAAAAEARALRATLASAGRVEDSAVCRYPDDVDLALADGHLEIQLSEGESGHFIRRNPALWTGEAIFGAIALVTRPFAPLEVRLASLIERLGAIPAFLAAGERVLEDAPIAWRERAMRECDAAVPLFADRLPRWWRQEGASPAAASAADAAAREACRAIESFRAWVQGMPARSDRPVAAGEDLLALLVRRGHWSTTALAPLLQDAREALDAESHALDRLSRQYAADGWPAARDAIAARHPGVDEYLPRFGEVWRACRETAVARDLVTWPEAPIRYVPIPDHTRD